MGLEEIVDVQITQNTLAVSQRGFGVMMILGEHKAFTDRIKYYSSLSEVAADFSTTSKEYLAASAGFSQAVRPSQIAIGRIATGDNSTISITPVSSFTYSLTLNGTTVTYASDVSATAAEIVAGLTTAIQNDANLNAAFTPTAGANDTLVIAPTVAATDYSITTGQNLSVSFTRNETITDALNAIQIANDDWYGLVITDELENTGVLTFDGDIPADGSIGLSINGAAIDPVPFNTDQATTMQDLVNKILANTDISEAEIVAGSSNRAIRIVADPNEPLVINSINVTGTTPPTGEFGTVSNTITEAAAWIDNQVKIFITSNSDPTIINTDLSADTSSIAVVLRNASRKRSSVIFHELAETEYADAAWLGRMLPTQPGAATWNFQTLNGITDSKLTPSQSNNARSKNANVYERRGGIAITREGKMANGDYIDTIVGIDWLQSRIQERVYQRMVSLDKIPFTDAGIAIIESELRAQLDQAVDVGLITSDYTVTVPKAGDVQPVDKANRFLPNVNFTATLQGAIHKVKINGVVSI